MIDKESDDFTRRSHAGLFFFVTVDDPFVLASAVLFVLEGFAMRFVVVAGVFDVDDNVRRITVVGLVAGALDDDDADDDDDDTLVFVLAVLLVFNEVVVRLTVETGGFDVDAKGRRRMVLVVWVDDGSDEPFAGLVAESVRAFTRRFSSSAPLRLMPIGILDRVIVVRG